jgi:hypothetical protein
VRGPGTGLTHGGFDSPFREQERPLPRGARRERLVVGAPGQVNGAAYVFDRVMQGETATWEVMQTLSEATRLTAPVGAGQPQSNLITLEMVWPAAIER